MHLTAGLVAGSVILIMSVTGTLLTFQQSVLKIVERSQRYVDPPSPGAQRLDVDALLARVRSAVPDADARQGRLPGRPGLRCDRHHKMADCPAPSENRVISAR